MIQREQYMKTLREYRDKDVIKIATGIRRSGKSTLFEMFQSELTNSGVNVKNIQSYNFELPENSTLGSWLEVYNHIVAKLVKNAQNYIFLDEIQTIPDFEKLADGLFARNDVDLYITGSNAYFLSSQFATILTGRYIEIKVLPLSFSEFASVFEGVDRNTLFNNYLRYGSFPYIADLLAQGVRDISVYMDGIYDSVLFKDVQTRLRTGDSSKLENVVRYMFDNIGNPTSSNKVSNTLQSDGYRVSHPTVDTYLQALTDSYILYRADRYDIKGKNLLRTLNKYYLVDVSLRALLLGRDSTADIGRVIENIVYLELLRRNSSVWTGKIGEREVDFVVRTHSDNTEYYQVSLTSLDSKTKTRELGALQAINDHNLKVLLTLDPVEYTEDGIRVKNLINWLLEEY